MTCIRLRGHLPRHLLMQLYARTEADMPRSLSHHAGEEKGLFELDPSDYISPDCQMVGTSSGGFGNSSLVQSPAAVQRKHQVMKVRRLIKKPGGRRPGEGFGCW